jgi:hypothetical protein
VLSQVLCLISIIAHPLLLFFCPFVFGIVIFVHNAEGQPENKVGVIDHAFSKIVLGIHTTKNVYENVNYAKTFMQGTIVNVFDGHKPGGKNAVWKLTVDFEMPSDKTAPGVKLKRVAIHQQHCTLVLVPAGKKPECSVNFTDSIGKPNHAVKGSMTYLPNAKGRASPSSTITAASAAPCVYCCQRITLQSLLATRSRSSLCPLSSPPWMLCLKLNQQQKLENI